MCGIVGYTGRGQAAPRLLAGLSRLAYRGYDSAGLALCGEEGLFTLRAEGKLEALCSRVGDANTLPQSVGIAHTRWATHGAPTEQNAHPHTAFAGDVAVVHNGIIENHRALRAELECRGICFSSDTDTEVVPHLLSLALAAHRDPLAAILEVTRRLEGAYALAILLRAYPHQIWAVRRQSPLAVAVGEDGCYLASDMPALAGLCSSVMFPAEGDIVCLTPTGLSLFDREGAPVTRPSHPVPATAQEVEKGEWSTFMEKELCEAPLGVARTTDALLRKDLPSLRLGAVRELCFLGCGSAWHVGVLGKYLFEEHLGLPVQVEPASEMRYRRVPLSAHALGVAISQSGETADTLAAARKLKELGLPLLGIVNVDGSALTRESDALLPTLAGPELAVATTKAYCAQVAALLVLLAKTAQAKGEEALAKEVRTALSTLPREMEETLALAPEIQAHATELAAATHAFYLGRGTDYAAVMEGALKLKEISYIHAQAYPAGELKHGTISLVEEGTPVVACLTQPRLTGKTLSGVEEVRSRGARPLLLVTGKTEVSPQTGKVLRLPSSSPLTAPLLGALAMARLALDTCLTRGTDPDRPRNLAKSVTVE